MLGKIYYEKKQIPNISLSEVVTGQQARVSQPQPQAPLNGTNLDLLAKLEEDKRATALQQQQQQSGKGKGKGKSKVPDGPTQAGKSQSREADPLAPTTEKVDVEWPRVRPPSDQPKYPPNINKFGDLQLPAKRRKVNPPQGKVLSPATTKISASTPMDPIIVCTKPDCPAAISGEQFITQFDLEIHAIDSHDRLHVATMEQGNPLGQTLESVNDLFALSNEELQSGLAAIYSNRTIVVKPVQVAHRTTEDAGLREDIGLYADDDNFQLPPGMEDYDMMDLFDIPPSHDNAKDSLLIGSPLPEITPDRGTRSPSTTEERRTPPDDLNIQVNTAAADDSHHVDSGDCTGSTIKSAEIWMASFPNSSGNPDDPDEQFPIEIETEEQKRQYVGPEAATKAREEIVKKREEAEAARQLELRKEMRSNGWVGSTVLIDKQGREKAKEYEKTKHLFPWSSDGILPWHYQRENLEPGHPYGPRKEPEDEWDDGI